MDKNVYWEDVAEEQQLPVLSLRLTVARMIAAAGGCRNLAAVHSNRDFARAAGNRDMFVDVHFTQGLVSRYATDWSGPQGFIRKMSVQMRESNCPGDLITVSGRVVKKYASAGLGLVDLDVTCSNQLGTTTLSRVTVELPARRELPNGSSPVEPAQEAGELPAELPEAARALIGRYGPLVEAPVEVNPWDIRRFCIPLEDGNPVYYDADFARTTRFGGLISPPAMLGVWMLPAPWPYKIPPAIAFEEFRQAMPDYPFNIVSEIDLHYPRWLCVGDRLRERQRVTGVSPQKRTKRGIGYFHVIEREFLNQRDEMVGRYIYKLFRYRREGEKAEKGHAWQQVQPEEVLPEARVPLQMAPDKAVFEGYISGYVRNWAGPGSSIKSLELDMPEIGAFSLNGFGETVTVSGRVTRKYGEHLADLEVVSTNYGAVTSRSRVTLALP